MPPLMDGMALKLALSRMRPGLPIIASTARDENRRMVELKPLHFEAVLNKPYGANVLLHALHHALHPAANETVKAP